jgi:cystathionine beta-lyase/cystathionine gamma-synthase
MAIDPKFLTTAVHAGSDPEPVTGAVNTPLFFTSTYVQDEPGRPKIYDYSRAGNPTRTALEKGYAMIEGAAHGITFASGLAAEQAVIQLLEPGDEVVVCDDTYGGTGRLFRKVLGKYGIKFSFVDMTDLNKLQESITAKTKLVWIESPTNPLMRIIDIKSASVLAHKVGAWVLVDNTFASPIFQRPLALGADMVLHSTTKYLGGHSDLIGGAVMVADDQLHEKLRFIQFAAGAVPGVMECFLLHRSLKTLALRMQQHEKNAMAVATFLEKHPKIERVFYPGLESHPQHHLAKTQMLGFSGMVSFYVRGDYAETKRIVGQLKLFLLAESLGGVESLINHPELMTHASVPPELRKTLGISPNLLRLSCGIEHAADLISDLDQALR